MTWDRLKQLIGLPFNPINFTIHDGRQSELAEGKLKIIERYTREVMNRLYGEDVEVYFCDFHNTVFEGIPGFQRPRHFSPVNFDDMKRHDLSKSSITYNTEFFKKNAKYFNAWFVIVHEITHYEFDDMEVKKINGKWEVRHPPDFEVKLHENLKRVTDFAYNFFIEYGLDEQDLERMARGGI